MIARFAFVFALAGLSCAQQADQAYVPLTRAYEALRNRDYDAAVAGFLKGIEAAPRRAGIRKDLAYTYLKIGENELARTEFRQAMEMDPEDVQVAMEYAYLSYEAKEQAEARRIFDRIRKIEGATYRAAAEEAFQNIDQPLAAGIARWKSALILGGDNFSGHFELATLAEQRDELELAAEHYEKAWRILPYRRSVLVDLGRVWKGLNRDDDANAALLAASRGGEPRAAEMARELLPDHYPYVAEFRQALEIDSKNAELRRELGYLLLRMGDELEAEAEFQILSETVPDDLLAATQLGFLLYGRGERAAAAPLFDRVLAGKEDDLANRVRAVLHMQQVLTPRPGPQPVSIDAKVMAERSIKAGYVKDALKYLQVAHEDDPGDFEVMLKLGWAYNILRQDDMAFRWFGLAQKSTDPRIASEAGRAWRNLRGETARFRTTAWFYPLFSTRWHDFFSYAQVKTELRTRMPVQPYLSVRFVGDTRVTMGPAGPQYLAPQYLSESSFIVAAGLRVAAWHGISGWLEAGSAMSYVTGHLLPDYRGGVSMARGVGHSLGGEAGGWFADTTVDGVFVSRFDNDFLVYDQSRLGYTIRVGDWRAQFYLNGNVTVDARREYWANFLETGPGVRVRSDWMPTSMYVAVNLLRGVYLVNTGNPRRPNFSDLRVGMWYAFTH